MRFAVSRRAFKRRRTSISCTPFTSRPTIPRSSPRPPTTASLSFRASLRTRFSLANFIPRRARNWGCASSPISAASPTRADFMLILPAIDLKDGRCVRLFQGDMDKETVYFDKPLDAARALARRRRRSHSHRRFERRGRGPAGAHPRSRRDLSGARVGRRARRRFAIHGSGRGGARSWRLARGDRHRRL